jgi:glycosyltransferase involved in cell wall biosynthesis
MSRPFVTILIDTYNHERFIERAVTSVLEQDSSAADREIVVVDDGSTDRTADLVAQFAPRVRLLRKANGGQASAFNAAIPGCRGQIIAFLDGDDWWCRGKLETVLRAFDENPDIGAVGHGFHETDEAGQVRSSISPDRSYRTFFRTVEEARQLVELRCFLGTSRLAVRRDVLERILPLPEGLTVEADEYLAVMAVALAGAMVLEQPLTNYRLHSNNLYQFATADYGRMARKLGALQCLDAELPRALARQGVASDLVVALTHNNHLETERLRLALGHGWSWESVRVERAVYRMVSPAGGSIGYRLFRLMVLGVAFLLPPRVFYRLRRWYDVTRLAGLRRLMGEPGAVPSLVVRKVHG